MPKITIVIKGISENLRRDEGIEQPYWGPCHVITDTITSEVFLFPSW